MATKPDPELVAKYGEPLTICEDCNHYVYKGRRCACPTIGGAILSHKEQVANGMFDNDFETRMADERNR